MASHIVSIHERPNLESGITRPGAPSTPPTSDNTADNTSGNTSHNASDTSDSKTTRFLGIRNEDFVNPEEPPYAYYIERPKGDITPDHSHNAGRTEFLIAGEIEWREPGKPPQTYSAGTLTYVEAGTTYGYTVIQDAKILIQFDRSPGMNYR